MADQVAEVKLKTDIVAVISEHVDLKKAGRNYKGLCPFHNEKTPSFIVTPELQMYKCFGCGVSGDVFTFLEEYEGMEFPEALKFLAERAGVKLAPLSSGSRDDKEKLYSVNRLAMQFYQYILWNHSEGKSPLQYLLEQRGLKEETIKTFNLGYSPNAPLALKGFLIDKKKTDMFLLEKVGIVYKGDHGAFDRFRGRVVFPLFDHRGNVVGFAGRILPGGRSDLAKYINTAETPIYHKSNLLYGIHLTRADIKRAGAAIVVEGELDMISTWQAGIKNVVAIKGSALTEEQINLLSRYTKKVILALDADLAGEKAAQRGIEIAEKGGLEVKVAVLEKYKDPDEAARSDPDYLKKCFKEAKSVWDFLIDSVFLRHKGQTGAQKAAISKEVVPVLSKIADSIVRAHYIHLVAGRLGVPIEAVSEEVGKKVEGSKPPEIVMAEKKAEKKDRAELLEDQLLAIAFSGDPNSLLTEEIAGLLQSKLNQKIARSFEEYLKSKKEYKAQDFFDKLPDELKEHFKDLQLSDIEELGSENRKKQFMLVYQELQAIRIKARLHILANEIGMAEKQKEKNLLKEKEVEFAKLTKELRNFTEKL